MPSSQMFSTMLSTISGAVDIRASKKLSTSTQTGKSLGKVRWLEKTGQPLSVKDSNATEYFLTGGCGDVENDVTLWELSVRDQGNMADRAHTVTPISKLEVQGSVTGLLSLDNDRFASASSSGIMSMYKVHFNDQGSPTGFDQMFSSVLHSLKNGTSSCPATAMATSENAIVTVGEDGSIKETTISTGQLRRSMDYVDPLSIYTVEYISRKEIITGNGGGQLKVWDLRSHESKPTQVMTSNLLLNNLFGVISIAQHPSQNHALIVGYQSGGMDLWDLRLGSACSPVANLVSDGDSGSLSEVYFHRVNPDHFFTCSQMGEVMQWYSSQEESGDILSEALNFDTNLNIEFLRCGLTHKAIYSSTLPMNSMSLSKNDRLICGGDSGILHCTDIIV